MRLEITRRADLAVRAMGELHRAGRTEPGRRLKSGELAALLETTTGFVPQVVGPLIKAGWVQSDPGPTGGYTLTDRAVGVDTLSVIEAVDGPTDDGRCVVADRPCGLNGTCTLHEAWALARTTLTDTLRSMPCPTVDA